MPASLKACAALFLLAFALSGVASAEKTFNVNDNNTFDFDQPSVVMNGVVAQAAFIGDNVTPGAFLVYDAAVNGSVNFSDPAQTRDTGAIYTPPVAIDNSGTGGNSPYYSARHPRIALRTATEVVIFFQATTSPADNAYRPFIARLAMSGQAVSLISVLQVGGFPAVGTLQAGTIEQIAFALIPSDNAARVAFASRTSTDSPLPFQVYYARIGLDNAAVVGTPHLLSSGDNNTVTGSDGFRPTPSIALDPIYRPQVAWAATDNSLVNSGSVYYAMLKDIGGGNDNVMIAATKVLSEPRRWSHPNIFAYASGLVGVIAADEGTPGKAGTVGRVAFTPDATIQNGGPVPHEYAVNFFSVPEKSLPSTYDLFRPEAQLDANGNLHVTGYGSSGTSPVFYAITLTAAFPFANIVAGPLTVGLNEVPGEIAGDYTKAAFGVVNGKVIVFWSGMIPNSGDPPHRNLDVSTVGTIVNPTSEGGCSLALRPHGAGTGAIPGAVFVVLPVLFLAVRRAVRRNRRRRAVAE